MTARTRTTRREHSIAISFAVAALAAEAQRECRKAMDTYLEPISKSGKTYTINIYHHPHQGARECARRRRQLARGQIGNG